MSALLRPSTAHTMINSLGNKFETKLPRFGCQMSTHSLTLSFDMKYLHISLKLRSKRKMGKSWNMNLKSYMNLQCIFSRTCIQAEGHSSMKLDSLNSVRKHTLQLYLTYYPLYTNLVIVSIVLYYNKPN